MKVDDSPIFQCTPDTPRNTRHNGTFGVQSAADEWVQERQDLPDNNIELIRLQMQHLQSLEEKLMKLRHQCQQPHRVEECGILQTLNDASLSSACACQNAITELTKDFIDGQTVLLLLSCRRSVT